MSIDSLTGDEFMSLDSASLRLGLSLFEPEITGVTAEVAVTPDPEPKREHLLDRLSSLLQLRKVFRVRLAEVEEEEGSLAAAPDTSTAVH